MPKLCSVLGCNNKHAAHGYCKKHYRASRRDAIRKGLILPKLPTRFCLIPGCNNKHDSRGYCKKHYHIAKRQGLIPSNLCLIPECNALHSAKGYCKKHYHDLAFNKRANMRKCSIVNCSAMVIAKGYCIKHYQIYHKYGDPLFKPEPKIKKIILCKICGKKAKNQLSDYCDYHYYRYTRYGDPLYNRTFKLRCSIKNCKGYVLEDSLCKKHSDCLKKYNKLEKTKCLVDKCIDKTWSEYCKRHEYSLKNYNDPKFIDDLNYKENRSLYKDNLKIKPFNKHFFDKWSRESSYVLGYLFADGHLYGYAAKQTTKFPRDVSFLSIDKELMDKIARAIEFPISMFYVRPAIESGKNKRQIAWSCTLNSRHLARQAYNKGLLPKKIMRLRVPKDMPDEFFFDFLRGLFDGDGTFGTHSLSICSIVPELLNDIKDKLLNFGIDSVIDFYEMREFYDRSKLTGEYMHNIAVRSGCLFKLYQYMYKDIKNCIYLSRKQQKFEFWFKNHIDKNGNFITRKYRYNSGNSHSPYKVLYGFTRSELFNIFKPRIKRELQVRTYIKNNPALAAFIIQNYNETKKNCLVDLSNKYPCHTYHSLNTFDITKTSMFRIKNEFINLQSEFRNLKCSRGYFDSNIMKLFFEAIDANFMSLQQISQTINIKHSLMRNWKHNKSIPQNQEHLDRVSAFLTSYT